MGALALASFRQNGHEWSLAATSIITAPLGAKLAHSLPVGKLKKIFAFLLLAMGTKMLWPLITPYFG